MDESTQTTGQRRLGCGATLVLLALILALFAGFAVYRLELFTGHALSTGAADLRLAAGRMRDVFVAIAQLQPQITVNEEVIFTQNSPILELAVINQQTVVERETSATWLGSTKRIRLRGVYNIKAGYDLHEPFAVHLDSGHPGKVMANLPRAKILSVEQQKLDILALENGIWNHVNATELSSEIGELNFDAKRKAWRGGIVEQAQKTLVEQLKEKLGSSYDLEVISAAGEPIAPTPQNTDNPTPKS